MFGSTFQVMNCDGKMYPFKNDAKFDIVVYGTQNKGKVSVEGFYNKAKQTWQLKSVDLKTKTDVISLL